MHSAKSMESWKTLPAEERDSSFRQGDGYAARLRSVGLWFRKMRPGAAVEERVAEGRRLLEPHIEKLAIDEHDRWVAEKRSRGWIAARDIEKASRNDALLLHNCVFPWESLSEAQRDLDRKPMRRIPELLALAGYEVIPA